MNWHSDSRRNGLTASFRIAKYFPMKSSIRTLLCSILLVTTAFTSFAADKKIVLIAGRPSHPPGMHEFRVGCLLLQ